MGVGSHHGTSAELVPQSITAGVWSQKLSRCRNAKPDLHVGSEIERCQNMNLEKTRCRPVPPGYAPGGYGAGELSFLPGRLGSTALQPCCSARWLHAVPAVPSPPLQQQATTVQARIVAQCRRCNSHLHGGMKVQGSLTICMTLA